MTRTVFWGRDNVDQLFKIVNVLGTRESIHFLEKRGVTLDDVKCLLFQRKDDGFSLLPRERRPWNDFVKEGEMLVMIWWVRGCVGVVLTLYIVYQ